MTFDESNNSSNSNNSENYDFEYPYSCIHISDIQVENDEVEIFHLKVPNKDLASAMLELDTTEQVKFLLAVITFGTETMRLTNLTASDDSLVEEKAADQN